MATEYQLSYTAAEIDEKLGMVDELSSSIDDKASVQSDWNQTDETAADFIKNKPFGEEIPTGGDTVTWDGNTEGVVAADFSLFGMGICYKISDATPTAEDIAKGGTVYVEGYGEVPLSIIYEGNGLLLCSDGFLAVIPVDNMDLGDGAVLEAEKGVYVSDLSDAGADYYVSCVQINGFTGFPSVSKLDAKHLPDANFYANDLDAYIYIDAACTVKATKDELVSAVKTGLFVMNLVRDSTWLGVISGNIVANNEYVTFALLEDVISGSASIVKFYTAEFTG